MVTFIFVIRLIHGRQEREKQMKNHFMRYEEEEEDLFISSLFTRLKMFVLHFLPTFGGF